MVCLVFLLGLFAAYLLGLRQGWTHAPCQTITTMGGGRGPALVTAVQEDERR